jgi:hypothetical protein
MAAEMVTDRWEGVRNKASVVSDPTWDAAAEAINALDGSARTLVSIVCKHPTLISIGGGGTNGLYVVQATDDGEALQGCDSRGRSDSEGDDHRRAVRRETISRDVVLTLRPRCGLPAHSHLPDRWTLRSTGRSDQRPGTADSFGRISLPAWSIG